MENVIIEFYKIDPRAVIPVFATDESACFDLTALIPDSLDNVEYLFPGQSVIIATGLSANIPQGYCLEIYSRSSHGFNHNVTLANSTAIIDSDYTDQILIKLTRFDDTGEESTEEPFVIQSGDRIAQAKLVKLIPTKIAVRLLPVQPKGNRTGGFGSTGR